MARTVPVFQLLQWKYAIKLEMVGLKHSQGSVYAHAKRVLGISGNKQAVIDHINALLAGAAAARGTGLLSLQDRVKSEDGNG